METCTVQLTGSRPRFNRRGVSDRGASQRVSDDDTVLRLSMRNPAVSINSLTSTVVWIRRTHDIPQFTGGVRPFTQQNEGCKTIFIVKTKGRDEYEPMKIGGRVNPKTATGGAAERCRGEDLP